MNVSDIRVWPGRPGPMGATWDGSGTNFTLFSAYAEKVELCLFDEGGRHETVIYEMHAKGFTMRHPQVGDAVRGTFAGLAAAPIVAYLRDLGITAVELLPIHAFVHDHYLVERGLRNYWGYNTIGFFAPHP